MKRFEVDYWLSKICILAALVANSFEGPETSLVLALIAIALAVQSYYADR